MDLIKYLKNNYYFKASIFDSVKEIKLKRSLNRLSYNIGNSIKSNISFITGDYIGYLTDTKYLSLKRRVLYLMQGDQVYHFAFIGKEFIKDDFITKFIQESRIKN